MAIFIKALHLRLYLIVLLIVIWLSQKYILTRSSHDTIFLPPKSKISYVNNLNVVLILQYPFQLFTVSKMNFIVLRTAIPLFLLSSIFALQLMGYVVANQTEALESQIASNMEKLERLQAMNEPIKLKREVLRTLRSRAKSLSDEERIQLADSIMRHGIANGQDPFLLLAVMEIESGFRRRVISNKGAVGLMQLRPFVARSIAKEMNFRLKRKSQLFDLDTNVKIGSYYLAKMTRRFGDLSLALEAYNIGPTRIGHRIRQGSMRKKRYTRKVFRCLGQIKTSIEQNV